MNLHDLVSQLIIDSKGAADVLMTPDSSLRAFLPEMLHPFPLEAFEAWRKKLASLAVLEMSYQGQLYRHLAGITNLGDARSVTRSGGMPLQLGELERLLEGEER